MTSLQKVLPPEDRLFAEKMFDRKVFRTRYACVKITVTRFVSLCDPGFGRLMADVYVCRARLL